MRISVEGGRAVAVMELTEATTTYFAIRAYHDRIVEDLETKYDGDERWSEEEDRPFLEGLKAQLEELAKTYEEANAEISDNKYKFI